LPIVGDAAQTETRQKETGDECEDDVDDRFVQRPGHRGADQGDH